MELDARGEAPNWVRQQPMEKRKCEGNFTRNSRKLRYYICNGTELWPLGGENRLDTMEIVSPSPGGLYRVVICSLVALMEMLCCPASGIDSLLLCHK
ncbi:hypothetical protein BgiBS90_021240 [Biomphalaria glabrata]|nr:hypothetical protein BgiMline_031270 [Biomphalaria glabrata]KAI8778590.1 hypothetical protein BgiBS90_021240 [Biomphalaria glabrata]